MFEILGFFLQPKHGELLRLAHMKKRRPARLFRIAVADRDQNRAMLQPRILPGFELPRRHPLLQDDTLEHFAEDVLQVGVAGDLDRKSTRLNSSHIPLSRMPSSA